MALAVSADKDSADPHEANYKRVDLYRSFFFLFPIIIILPFSVPIPPSLYLCTPCLFSFGFNRIAQKDARRTQYITVFMLPVS